MTGAGCSSCNSAALAGTSGGGRRKNRRNNRMRGGAMPSLSPASLTGGDSFDRDGPALANAAYGTYINDSLKLASIKNVNAMAGGGKKKRSKTAKKYRSKSKSRQQRGGFTTQQNAGFILDHRNIDDLCDAYPKIKVLVDRLRESEKERNQEISYDKKSEDLIKDIKELTQGTMDEEESGQENRGGSGVQRGGILELGAFINEAAVPFSLLVAQQRYKGRSTKGYKGRKSRKFRGSRRR